MRIVCFVSELWIQRIVSTCILVKKITNPMSASIATNATKYFILRTVRTVEMFRFVPRVLAVKIALGV